MPVYAVPGDVDRVASVGTNLLIRDGAFPILGPDDLAEVLTLLEPLYTSRNEADLSQRSRQVTGGASDSSISR